MPLLPGKSKKVISENIKEFHKGPSFKHTEQKFGKQDADKQAIAVAFANARKYTKKSIVRDPNVGVA